MSDLLNARGMGDCELMLLLFTHGSRRFQERVVAFFMMQAMWAMSHGK